MAKKVIPQEPAGGDVQEISLREALEERYLNYALSTIMHRALPDARDGLKPVHRRILYGMRSLSLNPGSVPKKSAKIVGEVMGSYHPHGDQAIYDAMVRLAQDFNSRYPMVDGQGNFGNIDGDNPAAMRYTEARLTDVARLMLEGIDEDAVEFRPTYDNSGKEPAVLPGGFPNLLANGSQGIAVGMATSIPPHNAAELCDAALHLIDHPNAKSRNLLKFVRGPDFPTGGRPPRRAACPPTPPPRSPKPTRPAAARSGCAHSGPRRRAAAAPGRWGSPKSRGWSRSRALSEGSPGSSTPKNR